MASPDLIDAVTFGLTCKCGPSYIGFEWAVKKTLEYIQARGSAKVDDIARDLWDDYMWLVRYLYWLFGGGSVGDAPKLADRVIPRLVNCVVRELVEAGLARVEGDAVIPFYDDGRVSKYLEAHGCGKCECPRSSGGSNQP
jgi:hypothetical protein